MNKKKSKRVDSSKIMESQWANRRRRFYESGAPVSILLLLVFVLVSGFIMSVGSNVAEGESVWRLPGLKNFSIVGSLMLILSMALGLYVSSNAPSIVKNHIRGIHLLLVLVVMLALARFAIIQGWSRYLIVVPVMITGIMMTVAYKQRLALGISSFLVLASGLVMADQGLTFREGIGVLLAAGSGTGIAILLLKKIRTYTKMIEVCVFAGAIIFVMILVVGLWEGQTFGVIFKDCLWGTLGAVSVGFLMQGLLPLTERMFRTATDITLVAYGEATKPLLRRLAVEAPGTFNHSWQIGMLSEAAAEAVGANGLLCRVGSCYHDVGKLNKPRYFVENQAENFNQHKELSPTMSRMIIVGHVKDGLELLEEYKIPKVLRQFTETHHGTTLVEYFYHMASVKGEETGLKVSESEFRYPGPKPYTLEAAIVMLSDAVEGATRAMREPTPSRIETLVHKMAMKRLMDGQFDDCDLTMKQLHVIEQSLVKSLCAMYHGRIAYPSENKPKGSLKK